MSREIKKTSKLEIEQKTPSFRISGVILVCVFGLMLFGFAPEANAGEISSTDMLLINIFRPICEVMYLGDQAIRHLTTAVSNIF